MNRVAAAAYAKHLNSFNTRQRAVVIEIDIKESKRDKRAQAKWNLKSKLQRLIGQELDSSFVSELEYIQDEGKVWVLLSGRKYTFFNVPEAIFTSWTKGAATCQTSDSGKRKKWWVGKTPSLGAFFNSYIKPKYIYVRGHL